VQFSGIRPPSFDIKPGQFSEAFVVFDVQLTYSLRVFVRKRRVLRGLHVEPADHPADAATGKRERAFELPDAGAPIPTASQWGVIVMSLLVLSVGTLVYTRRDLQPGISQMD